MKPVAVGTQVKLKNGDYLAEFGIVVLAIGEGPTATYQVRTIGVGYVWLFRDQFTIARRRS